MLLCAASSVRVCVKKVDQPNVAVLLKPVQTVFWIVMRVYFQSRPRVRNDKSLAWRSKTLSEHAVKLADALHST